MAEPADTGPPHIALGKEGIEAPRTRAARLAPPTLVRTATAVALVVAAVALIYRDAPGSYFFNDDVQWVASGLRFDVRHLVRINDYHHFYRPLIELYFFAGERVFGCRPAPFHLASIGLHLLAGLALFLLVLELTSRRDTAYLAALFFAVQPGLVEAVVWIGAITDLLPALWFILTLWLHARFLRRGRRVDYVASLATFVACLLTHEVAATLLVVMIALHLAIAPRRRTVRSYVPFALLLAASLSVAYAVNRGSYLIVEGHWRIGWHAIPNALRYLVSLPVWTAGAAPYLVTTLVLVAIVAFGRPRDRFAVLWMLAALAPATFFTWGNVSRYLYLPSAAFSLLLADGVTFGADRVARRFGRRAATACVALAAAILAGRFGKFARHDARGIAERAQSYERFADALRRTAPRASPGDVVRLDSADISLVPALYRQPAAEVAYCTAGVQVAER